MKPGDALLLLVDDRDAGRFVKSQLLKRAGFRVLEAATGREALDRAFGDLPDLVILDVNLPDISGVEVCRRLKQSGNVPGMQIMQLSETAVTDADRIRGLNEGADAYLVEPISGPVLVATVHALLRAGRAERELAQALRRESEAREEAERANRMKDQFLAMVSHELRTPLNAMTGWIWQLKRAALDEDGRRHAVEVLERNARIQIQLINDLLDVSRISAGTLEVNLQPVDLAAVLAASAEAALDTTAHRDKKIQLEVVAPSVMVEADSYRLQQIVTNLLNNAFQFTPAAGKIVMSCGVEKGEAFLRVSDTGAGIDPAFLPHVFERFRQQQSGGRHRGLGLGLAIVDHLVRQHHGRVSLASDGAGQGTTCTVVLPLLDVRRVSAVASPAVRASTLKSLRVLLVEDDADAREVLSQILADAGATVSAVESAEEAIDRLGAGAFDVLVSDIGLPGLSGADLVKWVREHGHRLPAVAVTAYATTDHRRRLAADGFDEHFAKPVDPTELVEAVARLGGAAGVM